MANLQPYIEDCPDDDSPPSFQGRQSPNAANVSTKRSHPSDLDKEKPPEVERVTNIDVRSDSGYSSYTAATVSSTNSAPSVTSQRSPPVVPATTAPVAPAENTAPKARRPTVSEPRQNSANSSPRPQPLSRSASQSSRPSATQRRPTITHDRPERKEYRDRRDSRVEPECTEPNCTSCGPNALPSQRRRPDIQPSQSARDVSRLSVVSDQRSMRSDPATYYPSTASPTYTRQSAYPQGSVIIQPSAAPRRRPSISARQQRPMSYSGEPGPQYWAPGMPGSYISPPQEHGPPPANSAQWRNNVPPYQMAPMAPMAPMGQMGPPMPPYMPQTPGYGQFGPSSYEAMQRPGMPSRNFSNYARNGPPTVITQAPREQQYSARYPQPQSATQPRFPQTLRIGAAGPYDTGSDTESSFEEDEEYDEPAPRAQRTIMPPPPPKTRQDKPKSKSKKERPPMPHAKTINITDVGRRMSHIEVDDRSGRERASNYDEPARRRLSVSRPAAPRQTQSDYVTPGASIIVNKSRTDRPHSSQTYDKTYQAYAQARELQDRVRAVAQAEAEARARKEARSRAREKEREEAERKAHAERYEAEKAEKERKRRNRTSKAVYQPPQVFDESDVEDESEYQSEEENLVLAPVPPRYRRPTDVQSHKGKDRFVEQPKVKRIANEAEDYISSQRGAQDPFNDQIHRAAKRASRVPSMPSHSGSSGSDRQSQSNRTTMTGNENNEIRLRVDASAPLSLSFNGDMEGRTLRMIPAENGMADIVIGSRNGDSTYQGSERGSVAGDRGSLVLSQARRQAEEMTERSLRSSRSRRDDRSVRDSRDEIGEQQRPLQRRRAPSIRN